MRTARARVGQNNRSRRGQHLQWLLCTFHAARCRSKSAQFWFRNRLHNWPDGD